jgi:hypothetical protein
MTPTTLRTVPAPPRPTLLEWAKEYRVGIRANKMDKSYADWAIRQEEYRKLKAA